EHICVDDEHNRHSHSLHAVLPFYLLVSEWMRTTSPVSRYSGIWISRPLAKRAVLVRALAEEPLIAGGVSAIGISTTAGSSTPIRLPSTTRPYRPWMPSYR